MIFCFYQCARCIRKCVVCVARDDTGLGDASFYLGPYAVSKAGMAALTRQIALDLAQPHILWLLLSDTAFLRVGTGRSDENQRMHRP